MRPLGMFLSTLALFFFIVYESFGQTFLQDAVIEYDAPSVVQGREMTTLGGGGIRVRFPDQTVALFNVVPPSLKKGCSGIDISLGSLGLLDFDHFGRLFESLMGPAGVMFVAELALTTLCPQCEEVLSKLMSLANQLNQMQLSKCGAVQIGGALGRALGRHINQSLGRDENAFDKALSSVTARLENFTNAIQQQVNNLCPNGKCGLDLMLNGGCVMDKVASELGNVATVLGTTETNLGAILRYYIGDLCFPGTRSLRDTFSGVPSDGIFIPASGNAVELVNFLAGFTVDQGAQTFSGCNNMYRVNGRIVQVYAGGVETDDVSLNIRGSICFESYRLVEGIISRIQQRAPLEERQKALLSSVPIPIFKLLNYGSVYTGFLETISKKLARYIAVEFSIGLLRVVNSSALRIASSYQSGLAGEDGKETTALADVRRMIETISEANQELSIARNDIIKDLQTSIAQYDLATKLYNNMLSQMAYSPIYGNVLFSRLIGAR